MMPSEEKITHVQLGCLCFGYLSGFSTLFLLEAKFLKQDVWMANVLAIAAAIGVLWLLCYVQRKHPDMKFTESCEKLLGKWIAKFAFLIYLAYFLELGGLAARAISTFYTTAILPNTPPSVLILLVLLVTSYAISLGLGTIMRTLQVILPFFILASIIISLFIFREVEMNPLLPQFQNRLTNIIYGGMISFAFPFGKTVMFGFLLSRVKNTRKMFVGGTIGIALSGVYLLWATYLTFGSLGMSLTRSATFPFFTAIQLVKFGEYMERIEITIIGIWTIFTLFELIVIQYVFTELMAHLFSIKHTRAFILPIGLLFFAISFRSFGRVTDHAMYNYEILPFSTLIPTTVIPILLACLTLIRKRRFSQETVRGR
ncbi:endospore germination permease [Paenibacillus sp. GCM10027628]|uniref:GerAB/ArcD/ProY family transporter n=1 Tax=Paenibacillus sp. GCM10027628 TaxID=3273413 RepID=UPI00362A9BD3